MRLAFEFGSRSSEITITITMLTFITIIVQTDEEIAYSLHGADVPSDLPSEKSASWSPQIFPLTPPTYFNYADVGYVTSVKNQVPFLRPIPYHHIRRNRCRYHRHKHPSNHHSHHNNRQQQDSFYFQYRNRNCNRINSRFLQLHEARQFF